jgi:hypothetical protein
MRIKVRPLRKSMISSPFLNRGLETGYGCCDPIKGVRSDTLLVRFPVGITKKNYIDEEDLIIKWIHEVVSFTGYEDIIYHGVEHDGTMKYYVMSYKTSYGNNGKIAFKNHMIRMLYKEEAHKKIGNTLVHYKLFKNVIRYFEIKELFAKKKFESNFIEMYYLSLIPMLSTAANGNFHFTYPYFFVKKLNNVADFKSKMNETRCSITDAFHYAKNMMGAYENMNTSRLLLKEYNDAKSQGDDKYFDLLKMELQRVRR